MKELKRKLEQRMLKENLSISSVAKHTKLSRRTITNFIKKGKCSNRTLNILTAFVERLEPYNKKNQYVNIGQVKVPQEHYDYLKRYADTNNATLADVVRKVIADVVDNEMLWKGLTDYMEITERAFNRAISKRIIPFIKIQDDHIKNIELSILTNLGLTKDIVRDVKQVDDIDVIEVARAYEEQAKEDYYSLYYDKKNNDEDDDVL